MINSSRTAAVPPRRNVNRLWFAQSVSLVGLQTGSVAVPLLAVDVLHADASQVALIGTLSSVPWLVAPVIGAIADRTDRKRLLVVSHLARSLLWLSIPVAFLLGVLTLHQVWLVAGLVGLLGVVFGVGYRTFLPAIVSKEELGAANGRMAGTDAVARATGPALAGALVQLLGAVATIVVQAVTSLLAGVATASIRTAPGGRTDPSGGRRVARLGEWWRSMIAGFRCLYGIKALRWLTVGDTGYLFCFDLCFALVVVFFRERLGLSAFMIGVIFSVGSLGGIVGAALANRLRKRAGFDPMIRLAAVLRGAGLIAFPLSLLVPGGAVVAVLVAGRAINACAWSVYEVLSDTYQQTILPDDHRGSATAASLWLGNGAATLGAATAAVLATAVDTVALLAVAGAGAVAAGLISFLVDTGRDDRLNAGRR